MCFYKTDKLKAVISDNVKHHDDDEEKAESCHAMMATLSFIH